MSDEVREAAVRLVEWTKVRDEAEGFIERLKDQIADSLGKDLDGRAVEVGEFQVVCGSRAASRKVNVVALQRAGIKKEEFSTVTPSIKAFTAMAEAKGWTEAMAAQYLIVSDERVPSIQVRRTKHEESEA